VATVFQDFGFGRDQKWYDASLDKNEEDIKKSMDEDKHHAERVYVTFDSESHQRACLEALCVGEIPAYFDWAPQKFKGNQKYFFRGTAYDGDQTHVLHIVEAVEPAEITWVNLGMASFVFRACQFIGTAIFALGLVTVGTTVVIELSKVGSPTTGAALAAVGISTLNSVLPELIKFIVAFETHMDYGDQQQSLMLKLLVTRLYSVAFILDVFLIPFDQTLSNQSVKMLMAVLISEAFYNPVLHLMDLYGICFKHYIMAPISRTQAEMNQLYEGDVWTLRYRHLPHHHEPAHAPSHTPIHPLSYTLPHTHTPSLMLPPIHLLSCTTSHTPPLIRLLSHTSSHTPPLIHLLSYTSSHTPPSRSERYTDLVKTIFTAFFYAAIAPQSLLLCAISLFIHYWVDKVRLLRMWKRIPPVDASLAKDSKFWFMLVIILHFVMTTRFYSSWSFDHVCAVDVGCMERGGYAAGDVEACYIRDSDHLHQAYRNDLYFETYSANITWAAMPTRPHEDNLAMESAAYGVRSSTNHTMNKTFVIPGETVTRDGKRFSRDTLATWVWCDRNQESAYHSVYPAILGWMSESQEHLLTVVKWINLFTVCLLFFGYVLWVLVSSVKKWLFGSYEAAGSTKDKLFSNLEDVQFYIPTIIVPGIRYPYSACDLQQGEVDGRYLMYEAVDYNIYCLCPDKDEGGVKHIVETHFPDIQELNKNRAKDKGPLFAPIQMFIPYKPARAASAASMRECEKQPVSSSDLESTFKEKGEEQEPIAISQVEAELDKQPGVVTTDQLTAYFTKHNPEKTAADAVAVIEHYKGKDGELRRGLKEKYGADL
jgi:hypothetical protein